MKPIRVLLADDQALFRQGLRTLLSVQHGIEVVGEAGDGKQAIAQTEAHHPDVVLMDLRMPVLGGVEATRQLRSRMPGTRVIVLTTFEDDEEVFDALRAGAVGYLLKGASAEKLVEAIQATVRGESFLQPSVAAKVVAQLNRLSVPAQQRSSTLLASLSEREREVLRQLALGKSNKEIAVALSLAEGTVKNHMSNVLGKLGVLDRTQAALKARELGLL